MKLSPFERAGSFELHLIGAINMVAAVNTTTVQDFLCEENKIVDGCWFHINGSHYGDNVTVQVIVPPDHPSNPTENEIIANEFATEWQCYDGNFFVEAYRTDLYAGLKFRAKYKNTGVTTGSDEVNFVLNLKSHRDKS